MIERTVQHYARYAVVLGLSLYCASSPAQAPTPPVQQASWLDTSLPPDARADLLLKEMTLAEKITMMHGTSGAPLGILGAGSGGTQSNGGAGYFEGVPRLGIPSLQMADASYGVTHSQTTGRYSTAMPSNIAAASTWDPELAFEYGALIGRELRAQGYNMSLGGGVNLTREPRNGRTFEYQGEDPLLAGTMVGQLIRGMQKQNILGDIKHYALNDQESGRNAVDITLSERGLRETDLLAFQLGIRDGAPGSVMCSYNRVGGIYACENPHLLTDILKGDWKFPGFVISDWGGTHSTLPAFKAGLDNEEPNSRFFGEPLLKALEAHDVTEAEVDDHVHRILRSMFAVGIVDHPQHREVIDVEAGLALSQKTAEQSIVLLRNRGDLLPLDADRVHSIVVIGAHADVGMISGGGSGQVDPPGGSAVAMPDEHAGPRPMFTTQVWFPTSPLVALRARFPAAKITFDPGTDPNTAAVAAKSADVAIVFGWQWEGEAMDLDSLALSGNQNVVIAAVAAANPRTIVVVESGGAVTMPWLEKTAAVLEVWYAGSRGATALSRILAGDVNPSAKLAITFPLSDADLPHPVLVKPPPESRSAPPTPGSSSRPQRVLAPFAVNYDEGLKVGYKWYDAEKKAVLFPFGFGLSYTAFAYSNLKLDRTADSLSVRCTVTNKGKREGAEIVEVFAELPVSAAEPPHRLVGFTKLHLAPGQSRQVVVNVDPLLLSTYDTTSKSWQQSAGNFVISVGGSSRDLPLAQTIALSGR